MNALAAAVLDALREDPGALACLRELVGLSAPSPEARWYTVRTLANELGVSEKVVRNAIARAELDAVKRGGRWYVERDAVERWLSRPQGGASRGPLRAAFAAYDRRAA